MKTAILLSLLLCAHIFSQSHYQKMAEMKNEIKNSISTLGDKHNLNPLQQKEKKNAGLAILYSLLLPGMGELYAGDYSTGKYLTIAEGVLWGGYIGVNTYGNWLKNRYISYAQSAGGVNTQGKDETYYAVIGEYSNIEQYNNDKALNRSFDEMYNETTDSWKWNTEQERRSYRNMWVSSEEAFNNLRFIAGALIVNRVISAVNAVRLTAAFNKRQSAETGWNVSVGLINYPGIPAGLSVNVNKGF